MKELLETLAKAIVDNPDDVSVTEIQEDHSVVLQLYVNPDDLGKIIGKQGRIAKALRSIIKSVAVKENKKAIVEIMD
ncbi:MAG: KH domain-containing protein [Candidatus Aquicultorales bacterium]